MRLIALSINLLTCVFVAVIVFHLLVLSGVVSYEVVWGGRLKSKEQMFVFEAISILLNAIFLVALLVRGGRIKTRPNPGWITVMMWVMSIVFLINTIGNVFAITAWERYLATPLTLVLCVLSIIVARDKTFLQGKKSIFERLRGGK